MTCVTSQPFVRRIAATAGPALIEKESGHATLLMATKSSSTEAAALGESLCQVFFFEERVLTKDLVAIAAGCQNLEYPPNGDPHAADAGLAAAFGGLDGDAVKTRDVRPWSLRSH